MSIKQETGYGTDDNIRYFHLEKEYVGEDIRIYCNYKGTTQLIFVITDDQLLRLPIPCELELKRDDKGRIKDK